MTNNASNNIRLAAILAAAGTGSRFAGGSGQDPKQCLLLEGRPLYMWSLLSMCTIDAIMDIVVVTSKALISELQADIERTLQSIDSQLLNRISVIEGGDTRQASVLAGLKQLEKKAPDFVIIHDAARPFLTRKMLQDTIRVVREHGACTLAIPVTDTVKRVRANIIEETLDRSELYAAQTPQACRYGWLLDAHEKACRESLIVTDDASLLEQCGVKVAIVPGDRNNVKLTVSEDLPLFQALSKRILGQINDYVITSSD